MLSWKGASPTSASSRAGREQALLVIGDNVWHDVETGATTDWLSARVRATPQKAFLHIEAETVSFADMWMAS